MVVGIASLPLYTKHYMPNDLDGMMLKANVCTKNLIRLQDSQDIMHTARQ